ncbi:helix-turn-helix transcriptional regulator [Burkholderia gladioli]|uniref:helix-turn-helix transcriptional regulator n=1 Tax=Burkholderia gladioli TaxID=28095 RepID=UPI001640F564|nr:AlpA family phage regulatory protein [Burkholderia gladioli]
MTQKTLSVPGSEAQTQESLSLITRVRQGRHARPARAGDGVHDARLSTNTDAGATKSVAVKTTAGTVYSTNSQFLEYLLAQVRSCSRDRLLKEREVLTIVGRSKAAMRRDVSLGLFPKQIKTGPKSSAWRESEVMGWVEATTILSRVANPGFDMKEFVAALSNHVPTA